MDQNHRVVICYIYICTFNTEADLGISNFLLALYVCAPEAVCRLRPHSISLALGLFSWPSPVFQRVLEGHRHSGASRGPLADLPASARAGEWGSELHPGQRGLHRGACSRGAALGGHCSELRRRLHGDPQPRGQRLDNDVLGPSHAHTWGHPVQGVSIASTDTAYERCCVRFRFSCCGRHHISESPRVVSCAFDACPTLCSLALV